MLTCPKSIRVTEFLEHMNAIAPTAILPVIQVLSYFNFNLKHDANLRSKTSSPRKLLLYAIVYYIFRVKFSSEFWNVALDSKVEVVNVALDSKAEFVCYLVRM